MGDTGAEQREVPQEKPSDLYGLLGVPRGATQDVIKAAFRKKAVTCHPDVKGGDPEAEERFKALNEASQVLEDADKRAQYDRLGHVGYYKQTEGWNPIPEEPRRRAGSTPRRSETNSRSSGHATGEERQRGSTGQTEPTGTTDGRPIGWEDFLKGFSYEDIFGFGGQQRQTGFHEDPSAETRRAQRVSAERKKYQGLGGERGRECANIFYMEYVREEVSGVLDFLVELGNPRGTMPKREVRRWILMQIDKESDALNVFQINRLREKYEGDHNSNPDIDVEEKIKRATELMQRLKEARAYMRGDLQPSNMPEAGHNSNSKDAYEAEFRKNWSEIAKASGQVDKKQNWFVPLTPVEVIKEEEKAKQWIQLQGRERGQYINQIMHSPHVAEDEQFIKQVIKKRRGWLEAITTPDRVVSDQYDYIMEKLGTTDEHQSMILALKKAFEDRFAKDKRNQGKDMDVEWAVVLARYRAEAEAMRITKSLKSDNMPSINLQKKQELRNAYEVTDFSVGFPKNGDELYNLGLKEGFLGR